MNIFRKSALILLFISFVHSASALISIPEIFADNMVLQQKSEAVFWGWAKAGETVTLKAGWLDKEVSMRTGPSGRWKLTINTPTAGGPYNISLRGSNEILLKNVLIGEVWLCSGQSNMEWSARNGINNTEDEIKNAFNPKMRLFNVHHSSSDNPQEHFTGEWVECTPETMQDFSAIGYFFGRKINTELGVPVGIINASWGGTPAEAWMPADVFLKDSYLNEAASRQKTVPWGPVEKGVLFNSMISPLIPLKIAGVLWYQGEANTVNTYAYKDLLIALINSWRSLWGYEFPFYYAQIAPYRYGNPEEGVLIRDAQRRALVVPNTGMIVLSYIGDTTNIHPKNKQDAALRFANLALNRHYKTMRIEDSGPLYSDISIEKNTATVSFDHSEGLHARNGDPDSFEIAGEDGIFYPAKARIKDQKVILQSPKVKNPVKVRFAWKNTAMPDLYNGAGLPASSFITE